MWAEARHQKIRALLQQKQRVSTEQAMKALGVSRETVRRDFIELEALGLLQRVHGGVVYVSDEPPLDKRHGINVSAKQAIARAAAQLLEPPVSIFLDAGSTTTILARELARMSGLTIITNSLNAATCFMEQTQDWHNQIIILPGVLNPTLGSTSGASTVLQIQNFHADVALLSPVAVNARQGASSFLHDEALIARAMSECAAATWILADHSKIGGSSREIYCPTKRISRLICDQQASQIDEFTALAQTVGAITMT